MVKRTNLTPSEAAELEYLRAHSKQMEDTIAEQDELLAMLLLNNDNNTDEEVDS